MTLVVHINGWPGSGKLTIGRLLAKRLNGRLLDNHTLINPAERLFARDDPQYWPLRKAVRSLVFDYAAQLPIATPLVLTDALADEPADRAVFDACLELAKKRDAKLIAVVLDCEEQENRRRLTAAGRTELLKLTDTEYLGKLRARHRLLRPTEVPRIDMDVSTLSAAEAADALYEHCRQELPE